MDRIRQNQSTAEPMLYGEIYMGEKENEAVCKWNVDTLDHLLETAKSFKPTWDMQAIEVNQKYKKGIF